MRFDLAGHVRFALRSTDPAVQRAVVHEMNPYAPDVEAGDDAAIPVELEELSIARPALSELQLAAGDGFVTGSDADRLYLVVGDRRASVPDALTDEPVRISFEPGFPLRPLFRQVLRPTLQLAALRGGGLAVHAAAVVRDGRAILVAGWSETGKTETALALAESGSQFLTDKWTLVGSGGEEAPGVTAAPFPINVGVRGWVLRYLPQLRTALPRRARLRFAAATSFGAASRPVRSLRRRGTAGALAEEARRALVLADRAALSPAEVAAAYGHAPLTGRVPIGLVVVLRTAPGAQVVARKAPLAAVAQRLAASALTERQGYFALRQRASYALGSGNDPAAVAAREAERISDLFATIPIVEVSTPFPTDPRRVAAALTPWLPKRT